MKATARELAALGVDLGIGSRKRRPYYQIDTTFTFSAAHSLELPYDSPCAQTHGHNWTVTITVAAAKLNENGMVVDFTHLKGPIKALLDHKDLNLVFAELVDKQFASQNPTAENIARFIAAQTRLPKGVRVVCVDVQESEGNRACYFA